MWLQLAEVAFYKLMYVVWICMFVRDMTHQKLLLYCLLFVRTITLAQHMQNILQLIKWSHCHAWNVVYFQAEHSHEKNNIQWRISNSTFIQKNICLQQNITHLLNFISIVLSNFPVTVSVLYKEDNNWMSQTYKSFSHKSLQYMHNHTPGVLLSYDTAKAQK